MMLSEYLTQHPAELLMTYTRNPHVLRMIGRIAADVYPLVQDESLENLTMAMPYATKHDNAVYHINRYDEGGLFRGVDPAKSTAATAPLRLDERFELLSNSRHALVVAASIKGNNAS